MAYPTEEGFYWAKRNNADGDYFGWEVVEVWEQGIGSDEQFAVAVPGFSTLHYLDDFDWGPRVPPMGGGAPYERSAMIRALIDDCHNASIEAGWYHDPVTGELLERNIPEMMCLIHSEISEAMEAYRKDLMDDKLPDFHGTIVELVDSLIRHFDLLGYLRRRLADEYSSHELDSGAAFVAKREFNDSRADHKPENRAKPGGKKF